MLTFGPYSRAKTPQFQVHLYVISDHSKSHSEWLYVSAYPAIFQCILSA